MMLLTRSARSQLDTFNYRFGDTTRIITPYYGSQKLANLSLNNSTASNLGIVPLFETFSAPFDQFNADSVTQTVNLTPGTYKAILIGAGGAGGEYNSSQSGGGGGAAFLYVTMSIPSAQTATLTIPTSGRYGSNSVFTAATFAHAKLEVPGLGITLTATNGQDSGGGTGGAGGTASVTDSGGLVTVLINASGGAGGSAAGNWSHGGGGGAGGGAGGSVISGSYGSGGQPGANAVTGTLGGTVILSPNRSDFSGSGGGGAGGYAFCGGGGAGAATVGSSMTSNPGQGGVPTDGFGYAGETGSKPPDGGTSTRVTGGAFGGGSGGGRYSSYGATAIPGSGVIILKKVS